jgi:predicted SAM-dependent methyltransferase
MKLNIGAGDIPLPGYTPVDRKLGSEAYPLAYPDASVDCIRASHVLEHFDWHAVPKVLADWFRVLKPGGELKVAVPNMRWIADNSLDPKAPYYMMGGQTDPNDYHKSCFTLETLSTALKTAGFRDLGIWQSELQDCASLPVSLNLRALKPKSKMLMPTKDTAKVSAIMSMPRLAFADNMFCAVQALGPLNIPLIKVTGAFWGQCLERGMGMVMDDGTEFILTIDYDTVFDAETVQQLARFMVEHPEADAISPVQIKREEDFPLLTVEDDHGRRRGNITGEELAQPLLRVASAHFGLTMMRVSALKKVPHPWFLGQPNAEGKWEEGRVDDDIYFWNKWKAVGNTLFLAPSVRIGHLQLMITWPNENFLPVHQYVNDYYKAGAPKASVQPSSPNPSATVAMAAPVDGEIIKGVLS